MKNRILTLLFLLITILFACTSEKEKPSDMIRLGIFGGMGPGATADLYQQVVKLTPAKTDQEHIPTIIYSQPRIPDRMASIRNKDQIVVPYIVEAVKLLEDAGASFIAIPCNTVHYFFDYMQDAVSIPIINMIKEAVQVVSDKYPDVKKVGLLATTATIETKLYEKELINKGFQVVIPDDDVENEKVMKAIFGIKSGIDRQINEDLLAEAGQNVIDKGAELIILGCTEIPLAFNPHRVNVPVVNATKTLAEKAIKMYAELSGKIK
ncbi:aspartate/glutamate racemase family protein [Bacteroidota bacterium]